MSVIGSSKNDLQGGPFLTLKTWSFVRCDGLSYLKRGIKLRDSNFIARILFSSRYFYNYFHFCFATVLKRPVKNVALISDDCIKQINDGYEWNPFKIYFDPLEYLFVSSAIFRKYIWLFERIKNIPLIFFCQNFCSRLIFTYDTSI